jgi:hypothetical protein
MIMSTDEVFEHWAPRGIGTESGLPCFVTGERPEFPGFTPNISGFVNSKEAGERVVEMFDGLARLDFRPHEPQWIQVKVGALQEHAAVLNLLMEKVIKAGNRISRNMIQETIRQYLEANAIPYDTVTRIVPRIGPPTLRP